MPDARKIAAATAGVAAAAGLAVVAKRKMNGRRRDGASRQSVAPERASERTSEQTAERTVVYHVKPDGDRWSTQAEGAGRPHRTHDTKKEAVTEARSLAGSNPPARLVIHKSDGTIQRQHTYGIE